MAEIPFFQDPFADSNPISEIDQPITASIGAPFDVSPPEISDLPPAAPASVIPAEPQPLTPVEQQPSPTLEALRGQEPAQPPSPVDQEVAVVAAPPLNEAPEPTPQQREDDFEAFKKRRRAVVGESFGPGDTRLDPKQERLRAFARRTDARNQRRRGTARFTHTSSNASSFAPGSPPARLDPRATEEAAEKINAILTDPFTAAPLTEHEWSGMSDSLNLTDAGFRIKESRAAAQKGIQDSFDAAASEFKSTADFSKWVASNSRNPLVSEWVANFASDRMRQKDMKGNLDRMKVGDKTLDDNEKVDSGEGAAFAANRGKLIAVLTRSMGPEAAARFVGKIKVNDLDNEGWRQYKDIQKEPANRMMKYNRSSGDLDKHLPSKEDLERAEKDAMNAEMRNGQELDTSDPVQVAALEEAGLSPAAAGFLKVGKEVKESLPSPRAGVTVSVVNPNALVTSVTDEVRRALDNTENITKDTYMAKLRESVAAAIASGSIRDLSVEDAVTLLAKPVYASLEAGYNQQAAAVQDAAVLDEDRNRERVQSVVREYSSEYPTTEDPGSFAARVDAADGIYKFTLQEISPSLSEEDQDYVADGLALLEKNRKLPAYYEPVRELFTKFNNFNTVGERSLFKTEQAEKRAIDVRNIRRDLVAERNAAKGVVTKWDDESEAVSGKTGSLGKMVTFSGPTAQEDAEAWEQSGTASRLEIEAENVERTKRSVRSRANTNEMIATLDAGLVFEAAVGNLGLELALADRDPITGKISEAVLSDTQRESLERSRTFKIGRTKSPSTNIFEQSEELERMKKVVQSPATGLEIGDRNLVISKIDAKLAAIKQAQKKQEEIWTLEILRRRGTFAAPDEDRRELLTQKEEDEIEANKKPDEEK